MELSIENLSFEEALDKIEQYHQPSSPTLFGYNYGNNPKSFRASDDATLVEDLFGYEDELGNRFILN